MTAPSPTRLHHELPEARTGAAVADARGAVIAVHGRGATAASILSLAAELGLPELHWVAPQASGGTWYPYSFLAPLDANEPGLSAGIARLDGLVESLAAGGIGSHRVALLGFSQGACLALELAARRPRRYGALIGFTGGLIGPPDARFDPAGSLDGTPVFLGAGDPDPHVPWRRVEQTRAVFEGMGARVTARRYPGMAHTINRDELDEARRLLEEMAGG
ncbi:MAG: dienelactone hydrolase family protein [Thermoanaerobaculia bacterium]|nr:dienelactone hydrolase family protein [Thermoanaerobaculia bacterium]